MHLLESQHGMLACNLVSLTLEVLWCKHTQFMNCSDISVLSSEASDAYDLSSWPLIYIDVSQPSSSKIQVPVPDLRLL